MENKQVKKRNSEQQTSLKKKILEESNTNTKVPVNIYIQKNTHTQNMKKTQRRAKTQKKKTRST